MKKLIFFISLIMFAFVSMAQTLSTPAAVTPDATITGEYYKMLTLDTITDVGTASYVFRIKGTENINIKVGLYSDRLSGTAGGYLIAYGSLNGVNYISLADTITITGVSSDVFDTETIDLAAFNWPYLKLIMTQSGTASCIHKPYIYAKY